MLGDADDFAARLRAVLPKRWFSDNAPVLTTVLYCFATPWSSIYGLLQFVKSQSRIRTAAGTWLDLIARDFFGHALARKPSESDQAYGARIRANLLYPRATRDAVITGLWNLTGTECTVFEPARPTDTGAYNRFHAGPPSSALGLAYGIAGGWGSLSLPYQAFVTAKRLPTDVSALIGGYGTGAGGYGVGALAYISLSTLSGRVTDADIQSAVVRLLPVNTTAWLRIT
jgi:hypothetical protein